MVHALLLATAIAAQTHAWRVAHERAVLAEFAELLAIPNLASDAPNIARNAAAIRAMFDKRGLAIKEFSLGLEALHRFVAREPLRRVHECVFGVLALESEPVDPRL